ncbi:hypothetical protein FRX31_023061 [Thalictrum thalictroides]|uniref:Uncharacterized protein n=1 Tax=Thalictrum thalictroides TaxID=46969 RepID=A0A7J6VRG3_THATH|nr:hypothetical protein FRX31_023061 [Thalictrum thalictroides]
MEQSINIDIELKYFQCSVMGNCISACCIYLIDSVFDQEGSRLRADYEATWDRNDLRDTLQRTARNQIPERSHMQLTDTRHYDKTSRSQPQIGRFGSNDVHPKRFKE